ncbi:MAG: hypothetical protein C4520_20800 [Candidatus Abyssobacteria bacterium SURF_5]|uniref:Right handed beta helix domain-containing protein n=1 Tax=Abyssobacteria bacterium (strain SURF_5) TaxID=2093360 RepID=A0A3A4NJ82_ABYX5|nr:MAG: hypothetical protein C4520_20800 [Candidatus Abyssubacteria bacterium SURF_5]
MHWARRVLLVVAVPLLLSSPAIATTYYVPDDYGTIQAALDAATGGDTVIVRDGTYTGTGNKNLDFKGKALTLKSENGPDNCIIDCKGDGRGFYFHSGEVSTSIIDGFTITNGNVCEPSPTERGIGGAIFCNDSSPIIRNCVLTANLADDGGGICFDSIHHNFSPTVSNCVISGNSASDIWDYHRGGGIANFSSKAITVNDCVINDNVALLGGGIYGKVIVSHSTISGNWVAGSGGGIYSIYGSTLSPVEIIDCIISQNQATGEAGGGIFAMGTTFIDRCFILGNSAVNSGGGIHCVLSSEISIRNCNISGNSATDGGGICCSDSPCPVTNCTISDNSANYGGGICSIGFAGSLTNCILWGNLAAYGPQVALKGDSWPYPLIVSYSDVEGGESEIHLDPSSVLWWEEGNINADPIFIGESDYHLASASPCVDAGTDAGIYEDIDGDIRPQGAGFDIGADEFVQIVYLSQINLESPINGSTLSGPPTFTWTVDAGQDNAYAVDFSLPPFFPFWSTYENMHEIILTTSWTAPSWMWERIPSGRQVYWRVRGVDRDYDPLTIVTSDEVWSFCQRSLKTRHLGSNQTPPF